MAYILQRMRFNAMSPIFLPHPIKPPTEKEGTVIFWVIVLGLLGFGGVCLYYGYRAPVEKAQEAAKLIAGGYTFIIIGIVMLVIRRFFSGYS